MRVDGVDVATVDVNTTEDEGGRDVATVSPQQLLEHGTSSDDSRLSSSGELVEFEFGADKF